MRFHILLFILLSHYSLQAQIVLPDTLCTGVPFGIEYLGTPASSYCLVPDVFSFAQGLNVEIVGQFEEDEFPLFSHALNDGEKHFVFTSISPKGDFIRSDFGDSFFNAPTNTLVTLDEVPKGPEGIHIINDGGKWWGFIVGGNSSFFGPEYLVRLDFGNSLTNTPTVENLGNLGQLQFPHDLFIVKENDIWVGLTINRNGDSITRFEFGDNLGNLPTGTNLGNIGQLSAPTGFYPIQVDGIWHLFIVNNTGNSLSRVDFGNSLLNQPTGVNLGGAGALNRPRDIVISRFCDNFLGIVGNQTDGEIVVIGFAGDIKNNFFEISTEGFNGLTYPHSLSSIQVTEQGAAIFATDAAESRLSRIRFGDELNLLQCESEFRDLEFVYDEPGNYSVQLITDAGLPSQNNFCADVVVMPSPILDLGADTSQCLGERLILENDSPETLWQGETISSTYAVDEAGFISATLTENNCTTRDSVEVTFTDCETCFLFPNVFSSSFDSENAAFKPIFNCDEEILEYQLTIYDRWGNMVFRTNDYTESWNGNIDNQPSTGVVFIWTLTYTLEKNNQTFVKMETGDVTLMR